MAPARWETVAGGRGGSARTGKTLGIGCFSLSMDVGMSCGIAASVAVDRLGTRGADETVRWNGRHRGFGNARPGGSCGRRGYETSRGSAWRMGIGRAEGGGRADEHNQHIRHGGAERNRSGVAFGASGLRARARDARAPVAPVGAGGRGSRGGGGPVQFGGGRERGRRGTSLRRRHPARSTRRGGMFAGGGARGRHRSRTHVA